MIHSLLDKVASKVRKRWAMRSSEAFISHLRGQGVAVGRECRFFDPPHTFVDMTAPYLLTIGDGVRVARGVTILTHGFEWCVTRDFFGDPLGGEAPVRIGNNVFIGMNATILKGSSIGDNVIVGAGAVVSGVLPDGCVAAGSPARPIMTLEEFRERLRRRQADWAKAQARAIRERLGRMPEPEDFEQTYFALFTPRDVPLTPRQRQQIGPAMDGYLASPPLFDSFERFMDWCFDDRPPSGAPSGSEPFGGESPTARPVIPSAPGTPGQHSRRAA